MVLPATTANHAALSRTIEVAFGPNVEFGAGNFVPRKTFRERMAKTLPGEETTRVFEAVHAKLIDVRKPALKKSPATSSSQVPATMAAAARRSRLRWQIEVVFVEGRWQILRMRL